jgi:hypothetical protein
LRIPAIGPEEADEVLALIDELTVEDENDAESGDEGLTAQENAENLQA